MNRSLTALFTPGEADDFFSLAESHPFDPAATDRFHQSNALWLAEFCRLVYRQEADELPGRPAGFRTRAQWLNQCDWREEPGHHFVSGTNRASLLTRPAGDAAVLVFRGTLGPNDLLTDLQVPLRPWTGPGLVHQGFGAAFERLWPLIEPRLAAVRCPLFLTGHSLGGALATMAASMCLHASGGVKPVALHTFGSPRVGDAAFGASLGGLFHARIVKGRDLVAALPPKIPNPLLPFFQHTGVLHQLDETGGLKVMEPGVEAAGKQLAMVQVVQEATVVLANLRQGDLAVPPPLADHAPVNYATALARLVVA